MHLVCRLVDGGPVGFVLRYWRGQGLLGRVFWFYGVLGSAALAEVVAIAGQRGQLLLQQVALVLLALYSVWVVVSVWRCAHWADVNRFHMAARAISIPWAINVVMVLGFIELGLVARLLS